MAGDRGVVRCGDPCLEGPGRLEPTGRVGGPVRWIAAGLVDGPQRFDARAEVCFIAVTDPSRGPQRAKMAATSRRPQKSASCGWPGQASPHKNESREVTENTSLDGP
jgi:hypothetical protein